MVVAAGFSLRYSMSPVIPAKAGIQFYVFVVARFIERI
jgi:hypothetical protein